MTVLLSGLRGGAGGVSGCCAAAGFSGLLDSSNRARDGHGGADRHPGVLVRDAGQEGTADVQLLADVALPVLPRAVRGPAPPGSAGVMFSLAREEAKTKHQKNL